MDVNNICLGCMSEKGAEAICPHCGWQVGQIADSPLYLTPGTILNGQYLIGRVLGHGGFGVTYLARDLNLDFKLAIKEYLPREYATRTTQHATVSVFNKDAQEYFEYGLEKFLEEAKILARFQQHPSIVSVYNFFKAHGTGYMVMEYIEGVTFKEYLQQQGGKLAYEKALDVLQPVMDALREVHSAGQLHRDVSPDNIYITSSGQIKLLDFGAARFSMGEHSRSLSVVLKPGYAPEEQYRTRGKQGPWTDVYAVSATLYRALTGSTPPEALDRAEEDDLKRPSVLGVKIPPDAERTLLKGLSVRGGDRFQEIGALQKSLADSREVPNNPGGPKKSNLFRIALISGLVSVLVVASLLFFSWRTQDTTPAQIPVHLTDIKEHEDFTIIRKIDTIYSYQLYLKKYPMGAFLGEARNKLDALGGSSVENK